MQGYHQIKPFEKGISGQMLEEVMRKREMYETDFLNFHEGVAQSKAIYKGEPVPSLYVPMVYDNEDLKAFKQALNGMMNVVNTTIDLYLKQPEVSALFQFDAALDALIRVPHHYDVNVPMGRFDIFYYGEGHYMFCELNADGASAMNEQKELAQVFKRSLLKSAFEQKEKMTLTTFELFDSWVKEVGEIYAQYREKQVSASDKPYVAIVDFVDKSSPIEFEVFKTAFERAGYTCDIVDPRHVTAEDGALIYNGQKIDIVYRRLVTKDLMDHYDELPAFVEGLLAGKTCVIGSVKTQIIHSKRFFEVLHHPDYQKYLPEEQRAFVEKHVPYTAKLAFKEIYIAAKNDYIIKPVDYYASKGVCAGSDYTKEQWVELLKEKSNEDYIVQRYCPLSLVENVLYNKESGFERHWFKTITGLFTYNGKLSGVYVRAGRNAIISGLHDGYTMSTFIANEK